MALSSLGPNLGGRDLDVQTQTWIGRGTGQLQTLCREVCRWTGEQGGRTLANRHLAWPLLCLLRELLGGPQAWPLLLASCLVPGALQLASLPLLPESPRYLLIDCGDTEACLAGESLSLGSQTALDQGVHLPRVYGSPFHRFHLSRKSYPSLCASVS